MIEKFLENYKSLIKNSELERFEIKKSGFNSLISKFKELNTEYLEEEKKTATNFNIFKIIKLKNFERLEVITHSPILANFLNPNGTHFQKELFYKRFIIEISEILDINPEKYLLNDYSQLYVELEKHTIYGNIDILISNYYENNKFAICIENKIGAEDQPKQLERYYEYLVNSPFKDNFILIYLTTSGYYPSEYSINTDLRVQLENKNKFLRLSHRKSIYNVLNAALNDIQSENVKSIVFQYINIIKNL